MTLKEIFRKYLDQLAGIYSDGEAARITAMVFEQFGFSRSDIIKTPDHVMSESLSAEIDLRLKDLLSHKPVQYVLGKAWFSGMWFKVNPHVLIPRPETEELVQLAADFAKGKNFRILDIGTGSGCIAVSLSKKLPHATVDAIDVSAEALAVAEENALSNNAQVSFREANFLDGFACRHEYDVIVSNPPYIPELEHQLLDNNVTAYEPHVALFVPDNDPIVFYRKIAEFGLQHLKAGGRIFLETHENYAKEVVAEFSGKGYAAEIIKDLFEKERFVIAAR